ncbi:MAG: hypothetical protein NTX61_03670 [Bacteroidetes bacterium]|nr:hypothetical protein [Bacteroidota bacterium]
MSSKRELHTLFIKHDTDFRTLSKKALSEVILKIILFQKSGTRVAQIKSELSSIIKGNVSDQMISESLDILTREKKIVHHRGRYNIHSRISAKLDESVTANKELQDRVFKKYLSSAQTPYEILKSWFQDTLILFFENYSMEWFNHLAHLGKFTPKQFDNNVLSAINETILNYGDNLLPEDHSWLKTQFTKFYESEESDENIMFWNFGMSLFSSRLITAQNYADKISIETYKNGNFLLDTNILMILDLEGHELNQSFESLDKILNQLKIKTKYLHITKEEYRRAIEGRKVDTMHVFESYDIEVLKATKCPFVQTAIKRGCNDSSDVERMFDTLFDIPKSISNLTNIDIIDYPELETEVQTGCANEDLKKKINEIHYRRLKRDKRENPKIHDAGLIHGVNFLRREDRTWILTADGTLKVYAIENVIRDETEIAIGLDALIAMFAVNSGGVDVDSSDFAPLFKNLIKNSLIPEDHIFDVRDLAFILSTNLRINDLDSEKVVEIANTVRRMRIAGEKDEEISLFLRREIEGQKLTIVKDLNAAKANEGVAKARKEQAEKERDFAYNEIREKRKAELRDKYDRQLRVNRTLLIIIPILISLFFFFALRYGLKTDLFVQFLVACGIEFFFGLIPYFPLNRRFIKKHSEYVHDIDKIVEYEIIEMKKNAKI